MKKPDLSQTINTLANVGVIAGIIFLGLELQQNNELIETQARVERRSIATNAGLRMFEYPDLRRATLKARNGEVLTDDEQLLLDLENRAKLGDWRFVVQEVRVGALDEGVLNANLMIAWRETFYNEYLGMSEYWVRSAKYSEPEFVEWMEENVIVR